MYRLANFEVIVLPRSFSLNVGFLEMPRFGKETNGNYEEENNIWKKEKRFFENG